ncbi:hypothetical protein [Methanobrevibacter sp.]
MVKDSFPLYIKGKINNIESNQITLSNIIWQPQLDRTEPTRTFGRGSISCSNGILTGKSGYVYGFENSEHWILSFDAYHIGYALIPLVPTTITRYDTSYVQLMSSVRVYSGGRYTDYPLSSESSKKYNEWQNIKIEKSNGGYKLYLDDVLATTFNWEDNSSQLGVGVDAWAGSNTAEIKNIKVIQL